MGYTYADGQYWDDTHYTLPVATASVEVSLYYQSISKEYIEFLRDENSTNTYGQDLHDAWVAQGMAPPQLMETGSLVITLTGSDDVPVFENRLHGAAPNPFNPATKLSYSVAKDGPVSIDIHDQRGRLVRRLVDGVRTAGEHHAMWDGRDGRGRALGAGVYFAVFRAGDVRETSKLVLIK